MDRWIDGRMKGWIMDGNIYIYEYMDRVVECIRMDGWINSG